MSSENADNRVDDPPAGCDGFKVWGSRGTQQFMRCACGATCTVSTFESESASRRMHYKLVRELLDLDGTQA